MTQRILIVDDDPIQRRLLEEVVRRFGFDGRAVDGGRAALSVLSSMPDDQLIGAVILDLSMPDMGGLEVLEALKKRRISVPVIVQTAHGGVDTAVSAMRAGAVDFVVKPVSPDKLETVIRTALRVNSLEDESKRALQSAGDPIHFSDVIASGEAMESVMRLASKAANSDIPALIEGESGVGKELMARAIQSASARSGKPFVTVNCGAIPDNLVESILFGHEKGAFTGAVDRHIGKFREADGGTLFLDEVGELPQGAQVKLLRALQEGEIDPVGGRKSISVDFRLISATNRNLLDHVRSGAFREDLYYRLNVFPLHIPPLRERTSDVPSLANHFFRRFVAKERRPELKRIGADAMDLLTNYDWPGNIRQLENAVFRAVVLSDTHELTVDDFPQILAQVRHGHQRRPSPVVNTETSFGQDGQNGGFTAPLHDAAGSIDKADPRVLRPSSLAASRPAMGRSPSPPPDFPVMIGQPASVDEVRHASEIGARVPAADPEPNTAPFGYLRAFGDDGHVKALTDLEKEAIVNAIGHYGGRMAEVARRLGIGRSTLYRKLKEYGLEGSEDAIIAAE